MHLQPGEDQTITVKAKEYYGKPDTVLSVQKDEVYSFFAASNRRWVDLWFPVRACGFNNLLVADHKKRISGAPVFELCGTIDENEQNHFRIGMKKENFTILQSGKLYFFANDHRDDFWYRNNWGTMKVQVIRVS